MNENKACDMTHYLKQGSSTPVLEDQCPTELSFNPKQTNKGIQNYLTAK